MSGAALGSAVAAVSGPTADWYLARGTGVVALLLLTASLVLGILGPLRVQAARWPRFAVGTLHRDISLLVLVFVVLHIATSVLDGFAPIRLLDGIVPFASPYRLLWLGLGTVSFDLLIALVITSLVRQRLGHRVWRGIHWLAYASWPVAVLHGLGTGTDAKQTWCLALTAVCMLAVVAAVWSRIGTAGETRRPPRAAWYSLAVLAPVGIAVFTLMGPLQRGWARRAGTPATLLGGSARATAGSRGGSSARAAVSPSPAPTSGVPASATTTAPAAAARPSTPPKGPFNARLSGQIVQTPVSGGVVVDIALKVSGGLSGRLRMRLAGLPADGGGISLTGSQVDFVAAGMREAMQGRIVALEGQSMEAHVRDRTGAAYDLRADLQIDNATSSVTGSLRGTPAGAR